MEKLRWMLGWVEVGLRWSWSKRRECRLDF